MPRNRRTDEKSLHSARLKLRQYEMWLTAPVHPASLGLFRTFFGLFIFMDALFFRLGIQSYFPHQDVFFKYPGFEWWPEFSLETHGWLLISMALSGLMITMGHCVRFSASLVTLVLLHFFMRDASFYLNHLVLLTLLSGLFIFIQSDQIYVLRLKAHRTSINNNPPRILRRYQLFSFIGIFYLSYFASGLEKLRTDWFSGDILSVNLIARLNVSTFAHFLYQPNTMSAGIWIIVGLELLAPIALCFKSTRLVAAFLLCLFHIVNHLAFNIGLFSYLMIFGIILYFEPDWPTRMRLPLTDPRKG